MASAIMYILAGMGLAMGAHALIWQQFNEAAILYLLSLCVVGLAWSVRRYETRAKVLSDLFWGMRK